MEKYLARNWFCCGVAGLFALLLWGQTVRYDFVWDDGLYITQNKGLDSLANIPGFFYRNDLQSAEKPSLAYRPIRNTVYAVLRALGGKPEPQPWIFHLANVLGHAVVCMLLFLTALLLCQRLDAGAGASMPARMVSLLIAIGYAAHPVNSEVVCWAKCLDDILAAIFVLASAISLLKWQPGGRGLAVSVVWFALAVFSKESAAPFALAAVLIFRGFHKLPWRQSAKLAVPFFAALFFYVMCRQLVIGRTSQCPPLSGSYIQTLIDMFPVAPDYFRLLWGMPPFCVDYNFMVGAPPHPFFSGEVQGGLVLLLFFGGLAAWLWAERPDWRMSAFGLIWVGLFMLPVSNLVPMMQYIAERFLYLPLMGFMLALGGVFLRIPTPLFRAARIPAVALVVIWTGASLNRMAIWQDDLTLFVTTELEHPGIKRVERNAVAAVIRLPQIAAERAAITLTPKQAEPGITILERARNLYPENDVLTANLGLVEAKTGRWPKGIALLELATRQNPGSAERWFELASACRLGGKPEEAKRACDEALRLDPKLEGAQELRKKLASDKISVTK